MTAEQLNLYNVVISTIGVIGGLAVAYLGFLQLKQLVKSVSETADANKLSTWSTVLDIENTMDRRRERLNDIARQTASLTDADPAAAKILLERHNEVMESYLNAVDRLAASIIRGLIPEQEARRDYRTLINEIMTSNVYRKFFHAGTPYRNITHLHGKWADEG